MEIKVTCCADCPFGHMEVDFDYDWFKLECSLEKDSDYNVRVKHRGDLKNVHRRKFKAPKDCKLRSSEIIVNFEV